VVLPGAPCIACGSATTLRYPARRRKWNRKGSVSTEFACTSPFLGEYEDIWSCSSCGLAFQSPPTSREELAESYAEVVDPLYLAEEENRREEFRELLGRLEAFQPPARLLEVGSFAGLCLDEAVKRGWSAVGLEPSRWAADYARSRLGAEVVNGTLADAPWEPGSFDAVCAWDVLEHLPDPFGDLKRTYELLRAGGVAAFTTVNIRSKASRLLRKRWPWLMHMHLFYFTPAALRILVHKAGFETFHLEGHPKRFRISYVLRRLERYAGPLSRIASQAVTRFGLANHLVTFDVGDVVLVVARKAY
jgi:cyclopropane fatty-acyl-phospholipid synthase-like methyltransferase